MRQISPPIKFLRLYRHLEQSPISQGLQTRFDDILDDEDEDFSKLIARVQCQGQTSGAAVVDQTETDHHLGYSYIKHLHPKP